MKEVLQKIIAETGIASRRQAEVLIKRGSVKINGEKATLGDRVERGKDKITIQGKPLPKKEEKIYLKLNKPTGYTCSNKNFKGEKNIFKLVNTEERLFSIGRLDKNSRGLIILTNDGNLSQKLSHPKYNHKKIYKIEVRNNLDSPAGQEIAKKLEKGIDIGFGDGIVKAKKANYLNNNSFEITLTQGKKRQIRRMFEALNLEVSDLIRINFSGIKLANLKEGSCKELSKEEKQVLMNN